MAKNGDVLFPEELDVRSYFSDIDLQNKDYLTNHNALMKSKDYRKASAYAESCGHEYHGAYLFNALEGRINHIGDFLLKDEETVTRIRPYYQEEEPTEDLYENLTWISSATI